MAWEDGLLYSFWIGVALVDGRRVVSVPVTVLTLIRPVCESERRKPCSLFAGGSRSVPLRGRGFHRETDHVISGCCLAENRKAIWCFLNLHQRATSALQI